MTFVDEIRACTTIAKLNAIYVESHRQMEKLKHQMVKENLLSEVHSVEDIELASSQVKKFYTEMIVLDAICRLTELREEEIKRELRGK